MLVSVLINNYNYGRYLGEAIDSALGQTYPHVEVVVVDDGSTDDSRAVIERYGKRVVSVLKPNGGQASAVNAGYAASSGDLLCWLDADDRFQPGKVEEVVRCLLREGDSHRDVLVCHPLRIVAQDGTPLPQRFHRIKPNRGANYLSWAARYREVPYITSMPSGVAATRSLAARVLPLPEHFPAGADNFFIKACAMLGKVYTVAEMLTDYRVHGANGWYMHRKPKSRPFRDAETAFLNQKLVENQFEPTVSYFDSWQAREYYSYYGCTRELIRLAFTLPGYHCDWRTLKWSLETLPLIVRSIVSNRSLSSLRAD